MPRPASRLGLCLLLLLGARTAPRAVAATPSLLDDQCPSEIHGDIVVRVDEQGQQPRPTLDRAEQRAETELLQKVCRDDHERCAYYRRFFLEKAAYFDPGEGRACVVMAIPKDRVVQYDRDTEALRDGIALAAAAVRDRFGAESVSVAASVWDKNDCPATEADYLAGLLASSLGKAGVEVADSGEHRIEPLLTVAPDAGILFDLRDERGRRVLGASFEFDRTVLNIEASQTCQKKALPRGKGDRGGSHGLSVELTLGTARSAVSEGTELSPTIRVNEPAFVQLYAIDAGGNGYLLWPTPGEAGWVEDQVSLGPFVAWRTHGQTEQLQAVAATRRASLSSAQDWTGFCRVPFAFRAGIFKPDVATSGRTYKVRSPNGRAAPPPGGRSARLLNALATAPVCGTELPE